MNVIKVNETEIIDTPHKLDVRRLYNSESAQAVHITLQAGESLKPHITPVDVFFYILEGTPEILVGKEKLTVSADCLVESPKDIPHCISNHSDHIARVLVVKAPSPISNTRLL